ncbi:MAG: hypothetical protein K2O91_21870 [Lachnospiraceae bacterium]|nr:hypothetical protein [Lachnospiraceae bacterium]
MCIILKNTPTKYKKMMEELVPPLFKLLKELNSLEEEIFVRDCAMNKEKPTLKIPFNQVHPKWKELTSEYRTRFEVIIDGRVSEKLMSRGYANSFGHPSKYFYLNSGAFSAEFTMRKEDVANVITHYNRSIDMKDKFVLRLIDDIWLIDEKYYGFEDEKTWHLDSI